MKIFTIGGSGLVGSRIIELLCHKHTFQDLSLTSGVDITDFTTLDVVKNDTEHEVVIHLAAKADVDGCEQDRDLAEEGPAYKINVTGTKNVVDACKATHKKIIYISTDFVFDGENVQEGGYTEDSPAHPVNWYAETKYKGEEVVRNSGLPYLIIRISYPYRKEFAIKKDFFRAINDRLAEGKPIAGITDHIFAPTFIDDIAQAIDTLLEKNVTGTYHVVGNQSLSPYDSALLIAGMFGYDKSLISKTTRAEYFAGKAPRPFNLTLNNAKITELGVKMRSFEEGLREIKGERSNLKNKE